MFWRRENIGLIRLLVLLVLLVSTFGPSEATPVFAGGGDLNPREFLNEDSRIHMVNNRSGAFDLSGWRVDLDPLRGPLFAPLAAPAYNWSSLGMGTNGTVYALALDGSGNLYAGGSFTTAGGVSANYIARWDGNVWSPLGTGVDSFVRALAIDISGDLYVGGSFSVAGGVSANGIARWNGSSWSALGSGVNGDVITIVVDGSGNVYAGGAFTNAGGVSANRIARWDGSSWSALGTGMSGDVYTLTVDGSGNLYAGGAFINAGGVSVNRIARWDGSSWSALGSGMNAPVNAVVVDGLGDLYAGGRFTSAGGVSANYIAKWDGSSWSALDSGMNNFVEALTVNGSGRLYAGGRFTSAGGESTNYIARWQDGNTWSALGTGMNDSVFALAVNGAGNLYAGGAFTSAGGVTANRVAVGVEIPEPVSLPDTGFSPGLVTRLPTQPSKKSYNNLGELWLEIPRMDVEMPIVGVRITDGDWDTTWLTDQAGWLEGTAFPTWTGNTALTAHVWDAWNQPGPFFGLKELLFGDRFYIHAWGQVYTYEVRDSLMVSPHNLSVLGHSEYDVVTLLTCESYSPWRGEYRYRRAVKAVLIDISPE